MQFRPRGGILADTCFWYALYTPKDPDHSTATEKADWLEGSDVLFPWPCLYETLNTKFMKNDVGITRLQKLLKSPRTHLIDDASYRDTALVAVTENPQLKKRNLSLVDMVLRLIVADPNVRVDALITFNLKDFVDICAIHRVEIL